jgi:hypothetical protein
MMDALTNGPTAAERLLHPCQFASNHARALKCRRQVHDASFFNTAIHRFPLPSLFSFTSSALLPTKHTIHPTLFNLSLHLSSL